MLAAALADRVVNIADSAEAHIHNRQVLPSLHPVAYPAPSGSGNALFPYQALICRQAKEKKMTVTAGVRKKRPAGSVRQMDLETKAYTFQTTVTAGMPAVPEAAYLATDVEPGEAQTDWAADMMVAAPARDAAV